jgi:hypothetical protein
MSSTTTPHPRLVADLKPLVEIRVDLDDRAFLFPAGKSVSQVSLCSDGRLIHIEAVYPFNQSRTAPRILTMSREDAAEFAKRLIEAVYYARPQLVIGSSLKATITVAANGYHFQFGDLNTATELFLGTASIWRFCQSLLRIVDLISPVEAN